VAAFIPPTAKIVSVVLGMYAAAAMCAPSPNYGGYTSTTNPAPMVLNIGANNVMRSCSDIVLESASIYYAANSSTCLMACMGWEE